MIVMYGKKSIEGLNTKSAITLLLHFPLPAPDVDKLRASNRNNHAFKVSLVLHCASLLCIISRVISARALKNGGFFVTA